MSRPETFVRHLWAGEVDAVGSSWSPAIWNDEHTDRGERDDDAEFRDWLEGELADGRLHSVRP